MGALCGECGVPKVLSKSHSWEDGCIVDRASGQANLYLHEVSSINALIDEISKLMGFSVDNLVFNSAARSAEGVVKDSMKDHPALFKVLSRPPMHRLIYDRSALLARGVGAGRLKLLGQTGKQGQRVVRVRIENPFNLYLNSSMIVGAVRAIYGLPVTYRTFEEGDGYIMEARQATEGASDESYRRLTPADVIPGKCGAAALPACGSCGAPREMGSSFTWDWPRGLMSERQSGERVLFPGLYLMNSLQRELDAELGISTADIFLKVERQLLGRKLAGAYKDEYPWDEARLRSHLALRGFGCLRSLIVKNTETDITVDNAFIAPLTAGRLIALWEHRFGREAAYDFSLDDNSLELSIYTAD